MQPTVDVRAYTAMLKRAYVEIKAADPLATVIAGGTSPAGNDPAGRDMAPVRFLGQIYANGGRGFFDAFAHHPYSFPCSPLTNASWNAFTQTRYLHTVMAQNGDGGKKIWGTEAGAPTANNVGTCAAGQRGPVGDRGDPVPVARRLLQGLVRRTSPASPGRCSGSRSATTGPTPRTRTTTSVCCAGTSAPSPRTAPSQRLIRG